MYPYFTQLHHHLLIVKITKNHKGTKKGAPCCTPTRGTPIPGQSVRTECAQIGHTLYKTLLCPRKVWRFLVWKQNCKKSIGFTLYHKRGGALPNLLFRLFYFMPDFCFKKTIAREVIFCNTNFRILLADNVCYRPIRILTHLKEEYNSQGAYSEKNPFVL